MTDITDMGRDYEQARKQCLAARAKRKNIGGKGTPKILGPTITPERILQVLPGTYGIMAKIAKRLHVKRASLVYRLQVAKGPMWDKARQAIRDASEEMVDDAEAGIRYCLRQRHDLNALGTNARWALGTKGANRGYREHTKVTVEGGDHPLQIEHGIVDADALQLPLVVRKQLLSALESGSESEIQTEAVPAKSQQTSTNVTRKRTRVVRKKA